MATLSEITDNTYQTKVATQLVGAAPWAQLELAVEGVLAS